jgi:hypothetical protein
LDKQTLLRSQRNDIFALIQDSEIDPNEFNWEEVRSDVYRGVLVSKLKCKNIESFYIIFDKFHFSKRYKLYICPGSDHPLESTICKYREWTEVLPRIKL